MDQTEPLRREDGTLTEMLQHIITKDYTVVGYIKRPEWETAWAPGYTIISYVDENMIGATGHVNAAVVLQNIKPSLFAHAKIWQREATSNRSNTITTCCIITAYPKRRIVQHDVLFIGDPDGGHYDRLGFAHL